MKASFDPRQRAFTLIEIMIVIAIIGLLAAIAIPNFVKSRQTAQRNACIKNLQQIDGAKETWALEQKKSPGDPLVEAEVNAYIKGGAPKCPASGAYTYNAVGADPTCSVATHVLPTTPAVAPPLGADGAGPGGL